MARRIFRPAHAVDHSSIGRWRSSAAWARRPDSHAEIDVPGPPLPTNAWCPPLLRRLFAHPHRAFEIDRHHLRYAALCHGDAEQAVHAGHGDRIMGDDD